MLELDTVNYFILLYQIWFSNATKKTSFVVIFCIFCMHFDWRRCYSLAACNREIVCKYFSPDAFIAIFPFQTLKKHLYHALQTLVAQVRVSSGPHTTKKCILVRTMLLPGCVQPRNRVQLLFARCFYRCFPFPNPKTNLYRALQTPVLK